MRIRLTVLGPHGTRSGDRGGWGDQGADVLVTAPAGTPLGAVAGGLRTASGVTGRAFWAGDVRLPDDASLGHPPLVHGGLLTADEPGAPSPGPGSPELRVVGGPDCGGVHLLHQGSARVGRAADAEVRLGDPDLSRLHAEIGISPGRLTVRDLGSTNGTTLDGVPVGPDPVPFPPGSLLRVGESTLTVTLPPAYEAAPEDGRPRPRPDGMGHIVVPRPARPLPQPLPGVRVEPEEPAAPRRLAFGGRRRAAEAERARLAERARGAVLEEVRRRRGRAPDAAALLLAALDAHLPAGPRAGAGPRVWERGPEHPDALTARVGVGDVPSHVTLVDDGGERRLTAFSVPVCVSLHDGVLGLAGPRPRVLGLARALVAQVAGLHPPQDVEIVLLCADEAFAADWAWARWLPHLRPQDGQDCRLLIGLTRHQVRARTAELLDRLDAATAPGAARPAARRTVVVLDGAASLTGRPDLARLVAEGHRAGIHAVCLDERAEELPLQCAAIVRVTGEVGTRLHVVGPGERRVADVVADAVSPAWADRFARALSPLREATGRGVSSLPEQARLLDLVGLDLLTPAKLLAGWSRPDRAPRLVLGAGARGPVTADLASASHVVVGGAPGSGRSEALAAMLSSLAVAYRPDELVMALVSGTPGPAAPGIAGLAELPHVVGVLEDPDARHAAHAVGAVLEELDRREGLLRGAPFAGSRGPDGRPLPRLVVAVDDVDALAGAFPGFVKGLTDVVHRGGAVGVHLAVTTGQPGPVTDLEVVAEADLRVALRVDDVLASRALVDVDDAVLGADAPPGRGLVRGADGAVVPFQAGRITGRMPRTATLRPTVVRQDWTEAGDPLTRTRPAEPEGRGGRAPGGPTDLALLTGAVRRAAAQAGVQPPRRLWEWIPAGLRG